MQNWNSFIKKYIEKGELRMVRKKMWNKGKKRQHKNKKQKWYSFIKNLIRNKNRTKKTCKGSKKKQHQNKNNKQENGKKKE